MRFTFPFLSFPKFGRHYNYKSNDISEDSSELMHIAKNEKSNFNSEDSSFIDIFGIKLAFDDILLIGLLIFLYEEDANDTLLFIALILLLLS